MNTQRVIIAHGGKELQQKAIQTQAEIKSTHDRYRIPLGGRGNREKPGNEVAHVNEFDEGHPLRTPPAPAGYSWQFNNNNKFIQLFSVSICTLVLGCVQTDATTPNIVALTMLGVVGCVGSGVFFWCIQWCANGCNNSQQCWDLQCNVGRIQPISLCKPCVMSVRGPNNVARAVQTDPTSLRYASAIIEQKNVWSCWLKSLNGFKLCATKRNNIQQHATGCANGRNM